MYEISQIVSPKINNSRIVTIFFYMYKNVFHPVHEYVLKHLKLIWVKYENLYFDALPCGN